MKLTIFGATGGTGRQLVSQALDAGHDVTAVVRDAARLPIRDERMRLVAGSMADPTTVSSAVQGADAVLSGLGARPKGIGICSQGTRAIVDAMQAAALMEDVLRDSGLDWTSVRPPRLTDKPLTGRYRTAIGRNVRRGYFLARADLAHAMLGTLD
jgi:uncharacterized protein YbjT (DUF2867 family)